MSATDEIKLQPIGLGIRVLHALRLILASVARIFFNLYYGKEGEKIPPITDEIIKLPVSVMAEKIRNKEVSDFLLNLFLSSVTGAFCLHIPVMIL